MTVIVFSKDRPLQLDAALRSWAGHCQDKDAATVRVLFKASTSRLLSLYKRLMSDHPAVEFIEESDFRRDLLLLVKNQDYICFVVDDTVFVRDFSVRQMTSALGEVPAHIGFSMRLGRNTTYCYTMNKEQRVPEFTEIRRGFLQFNWAGAELDFAYPLEVSSSIYRGDFIVPLINELSFKNPNTFEEALYGTIDRFRITRPVLFCAETSLAFAVPVNRVQQEVATNRAGTDAQFSATALADAFARGERIDVAALNNFTPRGCHQEVEFKLVPGLPAVPVVSVIIPCYNQAEYLADAVNSVVAQTFPDWEIIIIDDGSPDNSAAIARTLVRQHPEKRIRLVQQANGGLAQARNAGIALAEGAYILPLDADDKLAPTFLEKTVAVLDSKPEISVVYTNLQQFGASDKTLEAADFVWEKIQQNNQLNYCSLYRRECWEEAGGYNPNMIWGFEDWDFWIGCGERSRKMQRIPEPLFFYRVKQTSMFTQAMAHEKELRARVVLNHPALYDEKQLADARNIWSNRSLPLSPGAPKVSVIVPTYNRPDRLEETLRSILGQTLPDFEIIVVNDCGIEVRHVIARCRAGGKIIHLRHDKNRGLAAARNTGLRHARGRYIAYVDDDDIFLPDHLQELTEFLEQSGNHVAYSDSYGAIEEPDANGYGYKIVRREVPYSTDWNNDSILVKNLAPVLCFMHDRFAGIAAGEFDESLTTHEDWEYWIRLSRVSEPVHLKKVTCEFRLRSDGSSMTSSRRADFLRTARMIYKKHQALAAGKESVRQEQQKFLRGLEAETAAARGNTSGGWLRRLFGRAAS